MVEHNIAEELDDIYEMKNLTDAITGGQDQRMYLYYQLNNRQLSKVPNYDRFDQEQTGLILQ